MSEITLINQKIEFFKVFKVEADSLASQTIEYLPRLDSYHYHDADVYGETAVVRIKNQNDEVVLELANRHEDEFILEIVALFAELDYIEETFVTNIQDKYSKNNLI